MNLSAIALLIVSVFAMTFALSVFRHDRDRALNRTYLLFVAAVVLWGLLVGLFLVADSTTNAQLFANCYYIAALLIVTSLSSLAHLFWNVRAPLRLLVLYHLPVIVLTALLLIEPTLIVKVVSMTGAYTERVVLHMEWYLLYTATFVGYFITSMVILGMVAYHDVNSRSRHRLVSIILFTIIGGLCGMYFNLVLPAIGNYDLIMWGPLSCTTFIYGLGFAVLRYSYFDLKESYLHSLSSTLALSIVVLVYGSGVWAAVLNAEQLKHIGVDGGFLVLFATMLIAASVQPLRNLLDRFIGKHWLSKPYDRDVVIESFSNIVKESHDARGISNHAISLLQGTFDAKYIAILLIRRDASSLRFIASPLAPEKSQITDEIDVLATSFEGSHSRYVRATSQGTGMNVLRTLARLHAGLVIQMGKRNGDTGYLIMGEKARGDIYSSQDIQLIRTIADELMLAVEDADKYTEIQQFNERLRNEIETATKELRKTNDELVELDSVKDEFVSMASHQLRTPLTSVKGYLSMVLEGDAGKLSPDQRKMINEAYISSDRMVRLIGDFLNVSRIQTGKFVLDKHQVYLADVVEQEITQLQSVAAGRNVTIVYRKPRNIPVMELDEDKVRQVVMNYIDNAIFYSFEGSKVVVTLRFRDGEVEFAVKDSGIGIPKDQQAKLFQRFFRADNARKHRPDGTGVGLYLAKKVISEHDGKVFFESTAGKGSTFGFRLYPTSTRTHKTPAK